MARCKPIIKIAIIDYHHGPLLIAWLVELPHKCVLVGIQRDHGI
jgi:hypothetical protein